MEADPLSISKPVFLYGWPRHSTASNIRENDNMLMGNAFWSVSHSSEHSPNPLCLFPLFSMSGY